MPSSLTPQVWSRPALIEADSEESGELPPQAATAAVMTSNAAKAAGDKRQGLPLPVFDILLPKAPNTPSTVLKKHTSSQV